MVVLIVLRIIRRGHPYPYLILLIWVVVGEGPLSSFILVFPLPRPFIQQLLVPELLLMHRLMNRLKLPRS